MKGEFTENGELRIERAGKLKAQKCKENKYWGCGDSCPLIGEPTYDEDDFIWRKYTLKICNNRELYFEEFTDNRLRDKKDE